MMQLTIQKPSKAYSIGGRSLRQRFPIYSNSIYSLMGQNGAGFSPYALLGGYWVHY